MSDDESDTGPSPGDIARLYMDKTLPVYEREHAEEQMRNKRIVLLKHNSIIFVATVKCVTRYEDDASKQSIWFDIRAVLGCREDLAKQFLKADAAIFIIRIPMLYTGCTLIFNYDDALHVRELLWRHEHPEDVTSMPKNGPPIVEFELEKPWNEIWAELKLDELIEHD